MKSIIPILLMCLTLGCTTPPQPSDPFSQLEANQVATIAVGTYKSGVDGQAEFVPAFTITDPNTVRHLALLAKDSPRIETILPGIGGLSSQQFLDKRGRPLAVTFILNFGNLLMIDRPGPTHDASMGVITRSEPFTRCIYDLMVKYWPEEIQKKQQLYKEVGQSLEDLLFEGKTRERHTTTKSTRSDEAAPSATSSER
jgi:hypothetical protein